MGGRACPRARRGAAAAAERRAREEAARRAERRRQQARSAEAVLAVANLVWVLVAAVGGLLVPTDRLGPFAPVARLLPSGALGDGLRDALTGRPGAMWGPVLVLVIWGVLAAALAARTFRWGD